MRSIKAFTYGLFFCTLVLHLFSCDPDDDSACDNLNIIQNTYTGNIDVTSTGQDPAADFVGNNDSGIYTFEWCNPQRRASLDFDITTTGGGSIRIVFTDHEGTIVLDNTRPNGGNDSFSGVSDRGVAGTWTVEVSLMNISGDGSWSVHSGD